MSEARRHHFISQCYLKAFTKNGSKRSKLFAADLQQGKTFECKPDQVAHVRDFNRLEGHPPGFLESHLSYFEGEVSAALATIISERSLDNQDAWLRVLNIAALFAVRHPRVRERHRQFYEDVYKKMLGLSLATPERWASQVSQAQAAGFLTDSAPLSYEKMRDFYQSDGYRIHVPTSRHVQIEFETHDVVLECLAERQWNLYSAGDNCGHFLTTDNPVVLTHSDGSPASFQSPIGFGMRKTRVYFPVSSGLFAVGTFEDEPASATLNAEGVELLNGIVLAHAYRQAYARDRRVRVRVGKETIFVADIPRLKPPISR